MNLDRRTKILIAGVGVILVAAGATGGYLFLASLPLVQLKGTLYFNDSGEPFGGFEMACQWNVTLIVRGGSGVLVVTPEPDMLGNDALKKWTYTVTGFQISEESITMALDGHPVVLPFCEEDSTWNSYHNHYIATYLDPSIFPGFSSHYYVELRLAPPL